MILAQPVPHRSGKREDVLRMAPLLRRDDIVDRQSKVGRRVRDRDHYTGQGRPPERPAPRHLAQGSRAYTSGMFGALIWDAALYDTQYDAHLPDQPREIERRTQRIESNTLATSLYPLYRVALRLYHADSYGAGHETHNIINANPVHHLGSMSLHGLVTNPKISCYLHSRFAFADQAQNFPLPGRQFLQQTIITKAAMSRKKSRNSSKHCWTRQPFYAVEEAAKT
jgi:hypothetical protein